MKKLIVFMFSGQGSQYYQMGHDLYLGNQNFKKWMDYLDNIVVKETGYSVIQELFRDDRNKADVFDGILFTHPALFIIQYSLAQATINQGYGPDYVIGTSLGEFVAASVSGFISPEEALKCVIHHAKLTNQYCVEGGMTAVLENEHIYYNAEIIRKNCELIAVNYNSHFVVSGHKDHLNLVHKYLEEQDISYLQLPVKFGFHSELMDPIEKMYKNYIRDTEVFKPKIKMISCIDGKEVKEMTNEYFWDATRKPILFSEAIKMIDQNEACIFLDLGPSGTLAHFTKNNIVINDKKAVLSVLNPYGQDLKNFNKVINLLKTQVKREMEEKKMLAYVFPGQGSQQKGMGKELFDEFTELVKEADSILGYSIKELCLEDSDEKLSMTEYTQPALYVVNALSYLKKIKESGSHPDYVAGHSLGEYNALFAAGAFDFETGLKLVMKRGELMSKAMNGSMAAIVGLEESTVKQLLKENNFSKIDIANFNTPSQIVISGPKEEIEKGKEVFESAGARMYAILKVSGAFHSRYMEEAKQAFEKYLEGVEFNSLSIPVIANITARPYQSDRIKETLADQITHSVKWTESIRYLMGKDNVIIEQVGPGTVLSGLVKTIQKDATPLLVADEVLVPMDTSINQADNNNIDSTVEDVIYEAIKKETTKKSSQSTKKSEKKKSTSESKKTSDEKNKEIEKKSDNNKKTTTKDQKLGSQNIKYISSSTLGSKAFKEDFNLKYAYLSGSMYKGISSKEMAVTMGKAGFMGFFGTGGLSKDEVEEAIKYIQSELKEGQPYGMNLLNNPSEPIKEEALIDLYLSYGVKYIEASAYMNVNSALVRYRLKGLKCDDDGNVYSDNKIIAKISRPEVAEAFLSPAPDKIVKKLLDEGKITEKEAEYSKQIAMADALSVEADSGGHTDQGVAYALMPAILKLKSEMAQKYGYTKNIYIGAAGGIGTPEAAAAAFILGADYIVTGSVNQCTVEARTSDAVKDLLQQANVQDTDYAPAGDMFELGAKVQVLKKGLFFPARANKLYELYRQHSSLEDLDDKTKTQIQDRYFKRSFQEVFQDAKSFYSKEDIDRAERNPKEKMAMVFKWYFGHSTKLALSGSEDQKVDYQVHCGPSLGAFNQWVKGTEMDNWRDRNVDKIGEKIMHHTADLLNQRFKDLFI